VRFVSPAGWRIIITSCKTPCVIGTCKTPPGDSCGSAFRDTIPVVDTDTIYIDTPSVSITHDSAAPMVLRMTQDTWVAQAADNETFPCSPFVIVTHNVSISGFSFATEGCVAQLSNTTGITGASPKQYWATTTPVVVAVNVAARTRLSNMQFQSSTNVASRGDAVVRVLPESEGDVVDLDGSIFASLTGRVDTASPVATAAALLLPEFTGTITVSNTRMLTMRDSDPTASVTAWMGSTRTPPPPPSPVVCKTEAELHRTNVIYIITVSCLSGALVIGVVIAIVVHMRGRLRQQQLEKTD
jgi:hypothetical protein